LDVLVVFVQFLRFIFLARRFEYVADAAGIDLTRDPKAAIFALVNLHHITREHRCHCDKRAELSLTHPLFARRARAIGEKGGISPDRTREAMREK
jgi:Zn-dependent protease with chaperone function